MVNKKGAVFLVLEMAECPEFNEGRFLDTATSNSSECLNTIELMGAYSHLARAQETGSLQITAI